MHHRLSRRRFCGSMGFLGLAVGFTGCGEDQTQDKAVIPAESPAEKTKDSQQAFFRNQQKSKTAKSK